MLVTTKIKLLTNEEQHRILKEAMIRFNEACNYISQIASETKPTVKSRYISCATTM
jgi:predicted transposase